MLNQDLNPESPREWDNVGEILYTSTRYNLGDRRVSSEEIQEIIDRKDVLWLPVYAYIHSETRLNTTGFFCPWDSGQCGIIWCTKEKARKEWPKASEQKALDYLRGGIDALDSYFNGEVAGFIAEGPDEEHIDSCWGFFPEEGRGVAGRYAYPISEAKSAIDCWVADRAQQTEPHETLL